jgi:hypothetical protein
LEKELATGPLASSPRRPTAACPGLVLQYQPTNRARGLPRHRARHARPRRRATSPPTSTRAWLHARHGCCCHSELLRCRDLLHCRYYLPACRRSVSVFTRLDRRSTSASTTPARRSTPVPFREAAAVKPPSPTATAKSCPKQAEADHRPPLRRLVVDNAPLSPSRSAATSPS